MSSAFPLSQLLDDHDIDFALITEHKLLERSRSFLDSINSKYQAFSTIDHSIDQYDAIRCGKGGTAIMYKKELGTKLDTISSIDNDRIIGVELKLERTLPLFIICVYMPANNDKEAYRDILNELDALFSWYSRLGDVLIGGDFNGHIFTEGVPNSQHSTSKSAMLTEFVNRNNLAPMHTSIDRLSNYTFIPNKTTLDYILMEKSSVHLTISFNIVNERDILTSDHLPIVARLATPLRLTNEAKPRRTCIAWNKCTQTHIAQYNYDVERRVTDLLTQTEATDLTPDFINATITGILHDASKRLPLSRFNKGAKPYWSPELKQAHTEARRLRRIWIDMGRPRGRVSVYFNHYKDAKRIFRRMQRQLRESYENATYDELNRAAELDYRMFWKLLRNKSGKRLNICSTLEVENKTYDGDDVTSGFTQHYKSVFSNATPNDHITDVMASELNGYVETPDHLDIQPLIIPFTSEEISVVTKDLRKRKSPGHDGILYEHIIGARQPVNQALAALFSSILLFEKVPTSWQTSILIPVYKGKGKSKIDASSYRPISLIPCLCKLFEKALLNRINAHIKRLKIDFPCRQQNGFQRNLSCLTTAFNLQETVNFHIERHSDVYVAFLDQKAAFDTVRHQALFLKLGRLGLVGKILRVIIASYEYLKCAVKVATANAVGPSISKTSENVMTSMTPMTFDVIRGVRQGGVMSTFLYLVYIDDLLRDLESSSNGANIMSVNTGNPAFADDISLISISPLKLQRNVDIVYRYCSQWNMDINVSKSDVIVFSKRHKQPQVGIIYGSKYIEQRKSATHLGILQESNLKVHDRITERLQKARNAFFAMVGQGIHHNGVNPIVSASLYSKIILPIALYGSELWNTMSTTDDTRVNQFQHYVCKKIQGFPIRTRSDMAESMLGLNRITSAIETRKLMFLHKILSLPANCITKEIFLRKYNMFVIDKSTVLTGFIPDICCIIAKYKLHYMLNNYIANQTILPTKRTWKRIVNSVVKTRESKLWSERLAKDSDFILFQVLQPAIMPAIVYNVCRKSSMRNTMNLIAKLWCRPVTLENSMCDICNLVYQDELVHIIGECPNTDQLRSDFIIKLSHCVSSTQANELAAQDSFTWALSLLGAPILDSDTNTDLLRLSFKYIHQCLQLHLCADQ